MGPGEGARVRFRTVENAEGVFRSCSLGNECSSLASRRDPPHLNGNEKKKHRRRSVLKRVPRTRQASPAPVQQRLGRAGELRVRQAQARPCVRPRASAVHAQRTRPAARSDPFCGGGRMGKDRPWASAKYFTLLKWFKISGLNTPPFQYVNPNWVHILFGSAHVFCMTKFLAQTKISKVSKPNLQKPIE